jgi:hypothetical protein
VILVKKNQRRPWPFLRVNGGTHKAHPFERIETMGNGAQHNYDATKGVPRQLHCAKVDGAIKAMLHITST